MKRSPFYVLAVLALLFIVSAGYNLSTTATPTTTQGSHETIDDYEELDWEYKFLAAYQRTLGDVTVTQGYTLLQNAEALCFYLNDEHTIPEAYTYGTDELGMSSDQSAAVVEGAIRTHCPQYEATLQRTVS